MQRPEHTLDSWKTFHRDNAHALDKAARILTSRGAEAAKRYRHRKFPSPVPVERKIKPALQTSEDDDEARPRTRTKTPPAQSSRSGSRSGEKSRTTSRSPAKTKSEVKPVVPLPEEERDELFPSPPALSTKPNSKGKEKEKARSPSSQLEVFTTEDEQLLIAEHVRGQLNDASPQQTWAFLGRTQPHHSAEAWEGHWKANRATLLVAVAGRVAEVLSAQAEGGVAGEDGGAEEQREEVEDQEVEEEERMAVDEQQAALEVEEDEAEPSTARSALSSASPLTTQLTSVPHSQHSQPLTSLALNTLAAPFSLPIPPSAQPLPTITPATATEPDPSPPTPPRSDSVLHTLDSTFAAELESDDARVAHDLLVSRRRLGVRAALAAVEPLARFETNRWAKLGVEDEAMFAEFEETVVKLRAYKAGKEKVAKEEQEKVERREERAARRATVEVEAAVQAATQAQSEVVEESIPTEVVTAADVEMVEETITAELEVEVEVEVEMEEVPATQAAPQQDEGPTGSQLAQERAAAMQAALGLDDAPATTLAQDRAAAMQAVLGMADAGPTPLELAAQERAAAMQAVLGMGMAVADDSGLTNPKLAQDLAAAMEAALHSSREPAAQGQHRLSSPIQLRPPSPVKPAPPQVAESPATPVRAQKRQREVSTPRSAAPKKQRMEFHVEVPVRAASRLPPSSRPAQPRSSVKSRSGSKAPVVPATSQKPSTLAVSETPASTPVSVLKARLKVAAAAHGLKLRQVKS